MKRTLIAAPITLSLISGSAWAQCQWEGLSPPAGLVPRSVVVAPLAGQQSVIFAGGDVAAYNGSQWTTLENGTFHAMALAWYDRGEGHELYAAGLSGSHTGVQRWDGSVWQSAGANFFVAGYPGGPPGHMSYMLRHIETITSLAVFDDGAGPRLYAGGTSGPDGYTSLYRFNDHFQPGTSLWLEVGGPILGGPGTGPLERARITSLVAHDDGSGPALFAAGLLLTAGGVPVANLARFDGSAWSKVGMIWPSAGGRLVVLDDGSGAALYLTNMRWDGKSWESVGRGTSEAPLATYRAPGELTTALFSYAHGNTERRTGGAWTTVAGGLSGSLSGYFNAPQLVVAAEFGASGLYVGGDFTHAGGQPMARVARLTCDAPCAADCNGDGTLNLGDFGCFSTKFAQGDPYADCNADGTLNLGDFGCFQTKFALGCP